MYFALAPQTQEVDRGLLVSAYTLTVHTGSHTVHHSYAFGET